MYVCICKGISDRKIENEVKTGCNKVKQLTQQIGLGSDCGKCINSAKAIIDKNLGYTAKK